MRAFVRRLRCCNYKEEAWQQPWPYAIPEATNESSQSQTQYCCVPHEMRYINLRYLLTYTN